MLLVQGDSYGFRGHPMVVAVGVTTLFAGVAALLGMRKSNCCSISTAAFA